jgi:hypothetical protein
MKKFMTFSLLMLTVLLTGQTQQFVDHYDLRKNPGSRGLVESILVAAMSGKIQAYDYKQDQPNNLSVYELKNRLILEKEPEFEKWDSTVSYYIGDRVKYNDQVFEAIYDPLQGMNPGTGDYWITVSSGDTYFLPSDIAILKIQFAQLKKTRVNQWAHFSVPAEITVEGIERYQFSFRWDDLEKLLDQTNLVFYDYMLPEMGWITGSLFSFDDSFPQGSLIREVAQYAFSKSTGSRIYGKATNWNMLENSGYFPKLSFKWVDNSIDSIRLYVPAEHSSQHIADVHYQTFITKLISNKKLTFKGLEIYPPQFSMVF